MIKYLHIILLFTFFWINNLVVISQNIDQLKKEKNDIEKKISITKKLIEQTRKRKITTINDIKLIQKQIENRNKLISLYRTASDQLKDSINNLNRVIEDLNFKIERLKKEYEKLILSAYKRKLQYNELNFFLASKSFNEAYRKFIILNEYNKYRRKQGEILIKSKNDLNLKKQKLSELKQKNDQLISDLNSEMVNLQKEVKIKNSYLSSFRKKESKLKREAKKYAASLNSLNTKINEIIKSYSNKSYAASDFGKMAGKLPSPVKNGVIISKFGIHKHPVLKNVKIKNNGIDLKVLSGSDVYCVFDGVVTRVVVIPGYNKAVIVRHGKYLTVYANLKSVNVNNGQKIKKGDKIGTVYSGDGQNSNVVHFEIWEEKIKQNPEKWLKL